MLRERETLTILNSKALTQRACLCANNLLAFIGYSKTQPLFHGTSSLTWSFSPFYRQQDTVTDNGGKTQLIDEHHQLLVVGNSMNGWFRVADCD